ncbi:hypothetical protein QI633_25160 [Nocardioides sp. QY071]|uniref:hypothetical protein n=1 Tax=Nocardioides sp. QY071 TaxID=3044187 RepID=UPI00249A2384|nr:hypothetical protein [Nocardioides sp. QY071]WGY01811.1 hypothetical protein QI633_25160 [Nocardioides sp. QY071]
MIIAPSSGSDLGGRQDGYLRVHSGRRTVSRESAAAANHAALLFIDVEDAVEVEDVISVLQEAPPRLANTSYVLVRMPDVLAGMEKDEEEAEHARAAQWASALLERAPALSPTNVHIGVVQFVVGREPRLQWAEGTGPRQATDEVLLQRALRVELLTLLEFGKAVWRPDSYHYQLPSGQHAASFIRVGDAFRSPRDVHAIATWLTPRLRDGQAIVADSASLVPLVLELQSMTRREGWTRGPVEMLDEYPRTQLDINRVVRPLRRGGGGALALMSVNSSGRYQDMFMSALRDHLEPGDWSMVVLVNKTDSDSDREYLPADDDLVADPVSTWLGLADEAGRSVPQSSCPWCRDNRKAQVVRIDPRTFEALALPDVDLLMPSVPAARNSTRFWDLCNKADAVGVRAKPADSPSNVSRPKSGLMSVYIDFERLLNCPQFTEFVTERIEKARDEAKAESKTGLPTFRYDNCKIVLISAYEAEKPGFAERFGELRPILGLEDAQLVPVTFDESPLPIDITGHDDVLVFSLGSVTSWNMRQLLTRVQEAWRPLAGKRMHGLVVHARPQTLREWENLFNSFERRLHALWRTFLPWRDPLDEEAKALKELPTEGLTEAAAAYLHLRKNLLNPRLQAWAPRVEEHDAACVSPLCANTDERPSQQPEATIPAGLCEDLNPRSVLWGLPPYGGSRQLRRQSLYGYEARALTAYAAIGAAIHERRQLDSDYDPRRRVFDMPSITRSYYDAIIIAGILRWLEPQEAWWGHSEGEATNAVNELLTRTSDQAELRVLVPELLYAASQGKMPRAAAELLQAEAEALAANWDPDHRGPTELGLALLANAWVDTASGN